MFNELFKKTMKQDKISGKELAARLGVPPANVSYYLQKGSWEESKMREYAAALGYDLSITLVRRSGVSAPAIPEPTTQTQPREETVGPSRPASAPSRSGQRKEDQGGDRNPFSQDG